MKDDNEQANKPRENMERPKEGERGGKKKKDSEARMARRAIAAETLKLIQEGTFRHLDIAEAQAEAENSSLLFTPISCEQLNLQRQALARKECRTKVKVEFRAETTFGACRRLLADGVPNVVCLNFASAKNPGGGFLNGSQAQEECLSRQSGLYGCLLKKEGYYVANRECKTCLYTNHLIYSPNVPVFRNDNDELLAEWVPVSIITSPAVNKGALKKQEEIDRIDEVMKTRGQMVLNVAAVMGHRHIVLGAWGCGVFRQDPVKIAAMFCNLLFESQMYNGLFDLVVFAVLTEEAALLMSEGRVNVCDVHSIR